MSLRKKLIYIGILATVLVGGFVIYSYPNATLAKCPDDYSTDDAGSAEYLAATNKWTNDFFDANPDASLADWAEARHQFWVDNDCTAALQSYEDAKTGRADPETMEMIDGILRDEIKRATQ